LKYRTSGKRALDLIASIALVLILSPVLLVVAAVTWAAHGWPIIFAQQRPGLRGAPFVIFKFRTMRNIRDSNGELLPDNLRTTRFGHLLRNSSLDELPELFNVIRGDMSLVGPRPLMGRYLPRYTEEQARRHDVRPGITGLAQVRGRNAISWEEKFKYDLRYIDELSLANDLKILALTLVQVARGAGVNADERTTMPEFWGTEDPEYEPSE